MWKIIQLLNNLITFLKYPITKSCCIKGNFVIDKLTNKNTHYGKFIIHNSSNLDYYLGNWIPWWDGNRKLDSLIVSNCGNRNNIQTYSRQKAD